MLSLVNATRGHPTRESEIDLTSRPDGSLTHHLF